jgi:uncharacterized paraquat-inducible protein A
MPVWCHQCHAMLTEGSTECPRCGANLGISDDNEGFSRSDIAWFSAYTIGILIIPLIIIVAIGLICIFAFLI